MFFVSNFDDAWIVSSELPDAFRQLLRGLLDGSPGEDSGESPFAEGRMPGHVLQVCRVLNILISSVLAPHFSRRLRNVSVYMLSLSLLSLK